MDRFNDSPIVFIIILLFSKLRVLEIWMYTGVGCLVLNNPQQTDPREPRDVMSLSMRPFRDPERVKSPWEHRTDHCYSTLKPSTWRPPHYQARRQQWTDLLCVYRGESRLIKRHTINSLSDTVSVSQQVVNQQILTQLSPKQIISQQSSQ